MFLEHSMKKPEFLADRKLRRILFELVRGLTSGRNTEFLRNLTFRLLVPKGWHRFQLGTDLIDISLVYNLFGD